jgi:hypothetical protein
MSIAITLMYASVFALVLSFRAGVLRGKFGASILFGSPEEKV